MTTLDGDPLGRPRNVTIHVAIGNSDDRLAQATWSRYVADVDAAIREHAEEVHGEWFSRPNASWQNACWAFTLSSSGPRREWLQNRLTAIRRVYRRGLCGGEDIYVERDTFRSIGEAMTWCRKVLDDVITPRRWEAAGALREPATEPEWATARVTVAFEEPWRRGAPEDRHWDADGRDWREVVSSAQERLGKVVRTDA